MIYNLFGDKEISLIIENKSMNSTENPGPQVLCYAAVGKKIGREVRMVIANHPARKPIVKVLVDDKYVPLKINGKKVNEFVGKDILKLVYLNPNINEFVLEKIVEKPFTQKDFHKIISELKIIYRQAPEIQNNDETSINFTIAFITLKMIAFKTGKSWDELKKVSDIIEFIENTVGSKATDANMRDKYAAVFVMKDKRDDSTILFNFKNVLETIEKREIEEHRINGVASSDEYTSIILDVHDALSKIPDGELPIDLFGEVYECLASGNTKIALGQYFTRRHIIKAIVRMFFSDDDIEDIVENKKTIGDCCCGTGGFLTESFKYIKQYYEQKNGNKEDLTKLASDIIIGYDLDPNIIGRARVNMTLAGDGFSDIKTANTLTAPLSDHTTTNSAEIRGNINYILTNIPYGKGKVAYNNINSDYDFLRTNNVKRLELNFVLKIIDMLKDGGRASIIVPEGLLEAPSLATFREYLLLRCQLETIISLPQAAFAPYTKWKTYVIFLKKRTRGLDSIEQILEKNERVWAYIVDNDGYANSDKRFRTGLRGKKGEWLHDELSSYVDYDGITHSSLIEYHYEAKDEDIKKEWKNEWGESIFGKKYGYIDFSDVLKDKMLVCDTLDEKAIGELLKEEAENNQVLSKEEHNKLKKCLRPNRSGYSKPKKGDLFDNNGNILPAIETALDALGVFYDEEDDKFYDRNSEHTVYRLSLSPERYFRRLKDSELSSKELAKRINEMEKKAKKLFS